jgi:hypothetical protein
MKKERILEGVMVNENVLPDDYPVYFGYLYVADCKVISSDVEADVARLKRYLDCKEVRRCNMAARNLFY